jgi:hypothetical protein
MRVLLLACLRSGLPAVSQAQDRFPVQIDTGHYLIRSTATKEQVKDLGEFMEIVFATYMALLQANAELTRQRFDILLYKDRAEYVAKGGTPGSGAYYSRAKKALVGYYDLETMRNYFAHEGMHQFCDMTSKNFDALPSWFSEGVADCIGSCLVGEKRLFMCQRTGAIARGRLSVIQKALTAGKAYTWKTFFALDYPTFKANGQLCYAQAWSICHFLICFPKNDDPKRQIPEGKYRANFGAYYDILRRGDSDHDKAWRAAFGSVPMNALEQAWRDYILKMEPGRSLDIVGIDLMEKEADSLKLGSNNTGVRVIRVLRGGTADIGGIRDRDILIKFNGKQVPRGFAYDKLQLWIQEVPAKQPIKIHVLRAGRKTELHVEWGKK